MQQLVVVRRFMQQPLMVVLGVLTGAGAAKSGYGAWAAGAILTFFPIYFGAVVTFLATRSLAAWVAGMRRREALAWGGRRSGVVRPAKYFLPLSGRPLKDGNTTCKVPATSKYPGVTC